MITIEPTLEPVSLSEVKAHLRIDSTDEDSLISALIVAARTQVEIFTKRPLVTQTHTSFFNYLISGTELSVNLQSINSVKYLDIAGIQQTLAPSEYTADIHKPVGAICATYDATWPTIRVDIDSVEIEFICGYGEPSDVPQAIKQAMFLLIGDMFEVREASVIGVAINDTGAVRALLNNYKVMTL